MRTPVTSIEHLLGKRRPTSQVERDATRPLKVVNGGPDPATPAPDAPAPRGRTTRILAHVETEQVGWEASINHVMMRLCVGALVMVLALSPILGRDLTLALCAVGLPSVSYFGLCWQLLGRSKGTLPKWMPYLNASIEASIATVLLVTLTHYKGAAWALSSAIFLVYPLSLLLTAARMRPRMCVYTTVLIVAQYLGLYFLVIAPRLTAAQIEALPTFAPWAAFERAFWIVCIGGVGALMCRKIRALAMFGGAQQLERDWLETELGRYVSRDVAGAIIRGEAGVGKAERREVTVLFCDLRNFTQLCEREQPETVVALLNAFFERVCRVIEAHGGTVNKFLGDGVLALFGAPDEHPNHARAAAEAAHDILTVAAELRRDAKLGSFEVGIGLDTGDVVVGAIGSRHRVEYTAIGSPVNRAARLQGLSRASGHRIILSTACVKRLGPNANVVSLGEVSLKGFAAPEPVFAFRHA